MLKRRIMVRLEPELMDQLKRTGEKTHTPVSILVRQVIWDRFGKALGNHRRAKTKTAPRP